MTQNEDTKPLQRWRSILGGGEADGIGAEVGGERERAIDRALQALYDADERHGRLGRSAPNVARWLGDIRTYFPSSVVRVLQQDALERLQLRQLLWEPELLEAVPPDVHWVADLLALKQAIPDNTKDTARQVVEGVVETLQRRLTPPTQAAISGRSIRTQRRCRPRLSDIDWHRTIRANLKHYQPQYRTLIPETIVGSHRRRSSLHDLILCIDQSASMATSVIYASIFGAVLASLDAVTTKLVAFDTSVVDWSDRLGDPVEILFGIQLGGGTDIHLALSYCQGLIHRPLETILVLVSDLYEGGNAEEMLKRMAMLVNWGVKVIVLLALNDEGTPSFDRHNADRLAQLGIPAFACTPDGFPELIADAMGN
ncbi:MAG: VWA domain-containing protein [Cyanobacteria bacterium J055]|nr:MAG: VWA domain-containing protein [Cyanobacteria bacterium J055]